jgi:NADH:ubiquinone oxidoreductase subunit 6 (subunit J)
MSGRGGQSPSWPTAVVIGFVFIVVFVIADVVGGVVENRLEAARNSEVPSQVSSDAQTIRELGELITPDVVLLLSIVGLAIVVAIMIIPYINGNR